MIRTGWMKNLGIWVGSRGRCDRVVGMVESTRAPEVERERGQEAKRIRRPRPEVRVGNVGTLSPSAQKIVDKVTPGGAK